MKPLKLLLLTYHFPPTGGVGVQRVIKLIKYFPEHGIEPIVVTTSRNLSASHDPELLELEEVTNCKVHRIGGQSLTPFLSRRIEGRKKTVSDYFLGIRSLPFIDIYQSWSRSIAAQIKDIVIQENIDCIYSTSPPHSVHFLGSKLNQVTGKPWFMELRDSMTDWPLRKGGFINQISKEVERVHERRFYANARGVIFVTKGQLRNATNRVPDLNKKPTLVVPNGFDQNDFPRSSEKQTPREEFVITFTGNLSDHDVGDFCLAISKIAGSSDIDNTPIRLKFVGIVDKVNKQVLAQLPQSVKVELIGFVSHREAIRHQMDSDSLLLLQTSNAKTNGGEMINAKLFEYLATGLPIIAITPEGEQWEIVEKSKLGKPAMPSDIKAINDAIHFSYNLSNSNGMSIDQDYIASFSRKHQVVKIASFVRTTLCNSDITNES